MNKFCWGLGSGFLLGIALGGGLWLWSLPGAPSNYRPRFPIATVPLPEMVRVNTNETHVGFDIYTNPKEPPVVLKETPLPTKEASARSSYSERDGSVRVRETLWIEYNGSLYEFGHFEKTYHAEPNRLLVLVKTMAVDKARALRVRVQYPEIDIDETFGPFKLP